MRDACHLASKFFKELATVFEGGQPGKDIFHLLMMWARDSYPATRDYHRYPCGDPTGDKGRVFAAAVDSLAKGAKHKIKEKEKSDQKQDKLSQAAEREGHGSSPVSTPKNKNEKEKKKKKKSKDNKDLNGGEILKRPLSAYMLFNNHRRPTLKREHPGTHAFY